MKKLYFTILSFFACLTLVNAQVLLLQSNHAPVVGNMYDMFQIDSVGVIPGASGASAIWNFTATPTRTTITINNTYTTASTFTSSSLYPVGAIAKANVNGQNYYTSTSNQLNFWGGNIKIGLISADYAFSSPAIHAAYPMSYNTTTTSTFGGSIVSGFGNGTISGGTSTVIADGQGILNLPTRSFANALRVKTNTSFNFTVVVFVTTTVTGTVDQESYDYYTSLTSLPSTKVYPMYTITNSTIASSAAATQTATNAYINKDYQYVGINENVKEVSNLNLFPNPAKNNFNLSFVNENADAVFVEITNTLGQTIKKENLGNAKGLVNQNIDITNIEAGVYFVKVNVGNKSSIKKITIQ